MKKWPFIGLLILIAKFGIAQACDEFLDYEGNNLREFKEQQVRSTSAGQEENWLYSYDGNKITVNYSLGPDVGGMKLVHTYYLNEKGCPDSIHVVETETMFDSIFQYASTYFFEYEYNPSGQLISSVEKHEERTWKGQYYYNKEGRLDSLVRFANKAEGIFGTRDLDTLRYQYHEEYSYDELGRMTKRDKAHSSFWVYEYDELNRIIKKTSSPYQTRDGCMVNPELYYDIDLIAYNKKGLKSKVVHRRYRIKKNGKLKQVDKWLQSYDYQYWNQ